MGRGRSVGHTRERRGFEPRSQGGSGPKALFWESAFLQLSTEILEGCILRWFAPSEFSPWPAQEKCDSNSEGSQPGGGEGLGPAYETLSRGTCVLLWAERHTCWKRPHAG